MIWVRCQLMSFKNSLQIHERKIKRHEEEQLVQAQIQALQVTSKPVAKGMNAGK